MRRILLMSVALMATLCTFAQDVTYLDANGKSQTLSSGGYETISSQKELTNGWYVLDKSTGLSGRITVTGTVHLILKDGCTLTVPIGIQLIKGNSLTIYGQEKGTGKLTIGPCNDYEAGIGGNNHEEAGTLVVNGGYVEATAGYSAAGIGGGAQGYWAGNYGNGGTVVINGGTVIAKGNEYGAGIGGGGNHIFAETAIPGRGGDVTINGGNVTAIGGDRGGYGIGPGRSAGNEGEPGTLSLGWRNDTDRIYMSSVKATITMTSDFLYEDTKETATADNLNGRTIIPPVSSLPNPKVNGDVNEDGSVDISDIVAVINHIAGIASYEDADVNGDTYVDISDIVAIINIIANGGSGNNPPPPVEDDFAVAAGLCPDSNHPHTIDLGGEMYYSCCNVGASAPWEYGSYYAWGETNEKETYYWETYQYGSSATSCNDIGHNIAKTQYDVAYVLWGDNWQMPSRSQLDFLTRKCKIEWMGLNNIIGVKYTGPNGNSIFLPASGDKSSNEPYKLGEDANYASSEMAQGYENTYGFVSYLSLDDNSSDHACNRCKGLSIRPVTEGDGTQPDAAVEAGLCPDEHHPHVIDLGLDVKFSCCNVGASAPWKAGEFYSWGETETKYLFGTKYYKYQSDGTYQNLGSDISGTTYDVAYVKWGGEWHMPSSAQLSQLNADCSKEQFTLKGVDGILITGPSGAKIFLPASGYSDEGYESFLGTRGYYWSSNPSTIDGSRALTIWFGDDNITTDHIMFRDCGMPVRPAYGHPDPNMDAAVKAGLCPDGQHPHAIDMGNGLMFACCNVGASAPWEYGGYFAWGETDDKNYFDNDTYKYFKNLKFVDIGSNISGTNYDVAYVKWGSSWCMPTASQLQYLKTDCTSSWGTLNGVNGMKFTSTNGSSIFLPAAGSYVMDELDADGFTGEYWSSNNTANNVNNARTFSINDSGVYVSWSGRVQGLSVRAISK